VLFPTADELVEIMARTTGSESARAQIAADGNTIIRMGQLARKVPIPSHVSEYVARLIVATHPESEVASDMVRRYVRYGSSPRGAQAIILASKINALFDDRYNVSFDDVHAVAPASLRHRLLLNFEGQADGIRPDDIVADLIKQLAVRA
jgi:MoxR-like ATPase